MWFTRISIKNPVLATMMMAAFVVLGLFSYQRLRVDQFPDISFPVVVVTTNYPGATPEVVESDITRKIEEQVNTINGIKNLYSRSYEGSSVVIIEFELTIDPAQAAQDVREKVALVKPLFRKEVKEPSISRFDPADRPIVSIGVQSSSPQRSQREITTLADQVIKRRLENVRGVGSVTIVGGVKRQVQIYLRPTDMESQGIGVDQVLAAVANENQELPAGAIKTREQEKVVQVQGRLKSVEDFNSIIVARRAGTPVTLREIATVVDGEEETETLALVDGKRTIALDILKAQGQNTIEVVDSVKEVMTRLQKELPPDLKLTVIKDGARPIKVSVDNVRRTLIEGAVLTVLIVFLFLNSWRSTVITGLTLPIALIGTFLVMYWLGFTINMLTLMALSLCVGLLIDDAIVVRENIVRHAAMGKDHHTAALEGTQEIGIAVLATTFSIVAVFLPVGFMGGIIGRFFHQFGITVAAAVLISMFVSFTLDPMLSSVWPDPDAHPGGKRGPIGRLLGYFDRLVQGISNLYQRMLAWSLRHRGLTLLVAALTFFGSFALVPLLGSEFVPQADNNETMVSFNTPVGSSIEFTETKARQVDAALREFPEVLYTYTTVNTGVALGKNYASVYVKLADRAQRTRNQAQLTAPIRERLGRIAGVTVTNVGPPSSVGNTKLLIVSLQGQDLEELTRLSAEAQKRLAAIPGVVDIDTSLKPAKPTVSVELKRELASDLGIGVAQVGNALRPLIAGEAASSWKAADGENYDVMVRLSPGDRNTTGDLDRLMIASNQANADGTPKMVALRQIAELKNVGGASQINRRDLTREVEINANVYGRASGEVGRDMRAVLEGMEFKPGYRYVMGGSTKDMAESAGFALSALVLAIVFIYMILASQFGSFLQPLAIMSSLPLTLIGVFLALLSFRSTLNLFSIIGFIMLMGLVTKNAILLVDFINQARAEGKGRMESILEAAHVRLRPILMTTLAMIFGMLPLSLGLGEGAEQRAPMGQAVIGGVITSSILTLVVVPVIYTFIDDITGWFKRRRGAGNANPGAHGGGHAVVVQQQANDKIPG
jgi:HAE1 family hydrophobic/amphiphilic exporter-1